MTINFHKQFESALDNVYREKMADLLAEMLAKRFAEEKIRVAKKTIRHIAEQIRDGVTELTFDSQTKRDARLNVSDKEIGKVSRKFDKWLKKTEPKINKAFTKVIHETAGQILKLLIRQRAEHLKAVQSDRTRFENRIQRIWKKPLQILELYIAYVEELTLECYNQQMETAPEDVVFEILFRLEARAIQTAKEVLTLLRGGYPDGAHARWRSLHELSVVAMFIQEHGKDVAERYLAHEAIEDCKGAEQFQLYAKALGESRILTRDMTRIRKKRDDAIAKYGANFNSEFGWAAFALQPLNPKFAPRFGDLEIYVRQDALRPCYRMASWNVHAGAKGITEKLGLLNEHQRGRVLIGASDYGFTDPAQGASLSLMKCTSAILMHNHEPNIDRQIRAMVLLKMNRTIGDEFFKIQQRFRVK